ncbi:MAG: glycosyltransferase [Chloroflexi bacterium]|nr:glycosyltransferase [Chloroflexota bacterium]
MTEQSADVVHHAHKRTIAIIPAYNEAENLPHVLADLARYAPELDVVVIDDSSWDETATVAAQKIDGLILCPLDFGDERSAAKVAERLRVPVLLYATKEPSVPPGPSLARVSDSYCGNLSMASALYRRRIPFHFAGIFFPDEPAFLAQVDTFARAVAVVKGLRGARIGQVGVRPPTFETVGYDEAAMARKFGQNVIYTNLADIVDRARALPADAPEVVAVMNDVRASVPQITVAEDYLLNAAKLEVALVEFWQTNHLSAMAMQCWPSVQRMMGLSLCALYGRLTERRMLTACETDVLGALAMLVNYQAALGETLPHFVDWTIQHRENPNWLLAWHCGNAPISLAHNREQVALRSRRDMLGELPVAPGDPMAGLYQFPIHPGPVTFCRLAEYDGEWKMLIAEGEIIPPQETMAGTWAWVQVSDHARLYRTLVEEGFIHHASMIHGQQSEALQQACKFLDIAPVVVE